MKHLRYYLLIIIISTLPLISIFTTSKLPHTHDGFMHLARIAAYFKALGDGQMPVRWAGELNYGYGMPLFNFIYQLPYCIASSFLFLGLGLVNSFKITLALSFLTSGVFMLAFAQSFFKDIKKAFLIAVFYQFAPFRLVELLIRGSFGEVYTYTFLPLVLFGLTLLFKKPRYRLFFMTSIATTLLILSHNSLSLVFFVVSLGFVFFFAREKSKFIFGMLALLSGLLLSSFYWIPAIFEHKYTYGDLFMRKIYLLHFPPLQNFFIPNFLNSESLQTVGVSVQIGLFHVLGIFVSILILTRSKKIDILTKKLIIFSLLLFIISLFFMQPISKVFWANISLLRQFQFPWRFLAVVSFATSLLSVSFFSHSLLQKKWAYIALLTLVVVSTIYYWRSPLGLDKINEKDYWNYSLTTTYFGETDVIWSAGPATSYPRERVEIIGGKGVIKNFTKKSNLQTFTTEAKTDVSLVDHTQYFPGWRLYVSGTSVPIQFQDQNWRGQIVFSVPKGTHDVRLVFAESKIRLFADIISLLTLIGLLCLFKVRKVV